MIKLNTIYQVSKYSLNEVQYIREFYANNKYRKMVSYYKYCTRYYSFAPITLVYRPSIATLDFYEKYGVKEID